MLHACLKESLGPLSSAGGGEREVGGSGASFCRGGSRYTHKKKRGAGGRYGGGGGRREAGFGGFPTPARALGSRGGKYLPVWGGLGSRRRQRRLPLVGLEVVELVEFEADVLDGELQQVPETGQVLGGGPGAGVHFLSSRGTRGERGGGRTEERVRRAEEDGADS